MINTSNVSKVIESYISLCFLNTNEQYQHLSGAGSTHFLEEKLRVYYKKKYAITFSNATTALQTLCIAMDLNNTEILTSPINWGGSVSPFLLHGNRLRFTSFNPDSLNLSINDLADAITEKTKAVLSVDFNGTPVNSEAIKKICLQNNLLYISDSAQSLGSFFNNKSAGYFADAIVLSFSPGKSFFAGEGGAVITDNDTIYEKLLWFSQHPSRQKTVLGLSNFNSYAPINGRMNPLSAIILNNTFEVTYNALKEYQFKCFKLIRQLYANNLIEETPHIPDPSASTFFGFSLKLKKAFGINQVNEFLKVINQPFIAVPFTPNIIPFDGAFRKQFKFRFSCSKALLDQKSGIQSCDRIKLINNPLNIIL